MEHNKDKLQEEAQKEIAEGTLEEVTGGEGVNALHGVNCYFEPTNPVKYEIRDSALRAECKSICRGLYLCSCHGSGNCIDRWHIIEKLSGTTYVASPQGRLNHDEQRKWVNGVNL